VASITLSASISPNERLQQVFHPWTSYCHRAAVRAGQRGRADQRPVSRPRVHLAGHARHPGRVRGRQAGGHRGHVVPRHQAQQGPAPAPAGWASVIGAGTIAGIGFTVSLLIAALAFTGPELAEAKVGVLTAGCARRSSPRPCSS
jgi:hypothetical protein